MESEKTRTLRQNRALHKWCTELATEANDQGISMKAVMQNIEISWSMDAVKSIVQAISKAKYGKSSTSELTTKQLSDCCEEVHKIFAENGVYVEFPSEEELEFIKHFNCKF